MSDHHQDPDAPNPLVSAVAHHMHLADPDAPDAAAGPPRDPGSGGMRFLAWLVLIVAVGFTVWAQWLGPAPAPVAQTEMSPPGGLMRIAGRYAVGAKHLLGGLAPGEDAADQSGSISTLAGQVGDFAGSPEDDLRAAIVEAELVNTEAALATLDELETALLLAEEPPLYLDTLQSDIDAVRGLLAESPVAPADPDAFRERHGWFGDLALSLGLDDASPARAPVLAKAQRTTLVLVVGVLLFVALIFVGFVLAIVAIVLIATRRLKAAYRPHAPGGSVYLEVFALFILGFLGVSFASEAIYNSTGADYSRLLIWLLLLVPFWALIRGARGADFRNAMGWHTGKGLFREIAAGIVGYIACIPIFLAGIALTFLLMGVSALLQGSGEEGGGGAGPTHPILDQVDPHNLWSVLGVYAVAAVWAPIVEESLFRGALYHHLRGRLHPLLAGLGVAFIFAVIHPQGWIAVPALMSLAVTFALLREWRGSLIAPVVGHAIHNGALMTALVLALS